MLHNSSSIIPPKVPPANAVIPPYIDGIGAIAHFVWYQLDNFPRCPFIRQLSDDVGSVLRLRC